MISLFVRRCRLTKLTPIMNRAAAYSAECSVATAISVSSNISKMPAQRKARPSHRWGLATDLASKEKSGGGFEPWEGVKCICRGLVVDAPRNPVSPLCDLLVASR
jgi:hypothetical protein